MLLKSTKGSVFFTKHGSFGVRILNFSKFINPRNNIDRVSSPSFKYLAAVAMPLDLPNRNVYMAFNFEANYGLPSNDSYNEWIDRWNLNEESLGIGNNVTAIDGRQMVKSKRTARRPLCYGRHSFYQAFISYLNYLRMNGTACLLKTICEIAASSLDENNGVLGNIFKILFMPTTSTPENLPFSLPSLTRQDLYQAECRGSKSKTQTEAITDHRVDRTEDCLDYMHWCPHQIVDMISTWY
uniref:Uncharacterized protein n=1 Tax=Glossina brevipalpis TaxID=37001 RepID=A0A1A9WGQ4_9MUSC